MRLPPDLVGSPWAHRLEVALSAVRSAGAALMELRGTIRGEEAGGGQLKTSTDLAAEGWVLGYLAGSFPDDVFLAEERYEIAGERWPGRERYWTVDALDGTRSYVDGFSGFCVQVAFVDEGEPRIAAIAEPVTGAAYVAAAGFGAWRLVDSEARRLMTASSELAIGTRFVDSTLPTGAPGELFHRLGGRFVECGSVGLKICRVVEGAADVYAKRFRYKLWDVAPGELLLREAGGVLSSWNGTRIDYSAAATHFETLLAAPAGVHGELVRELG
jgi:3'(2'), 5'-bisphosphate nucleotidase/myo-inositol-1(or 4)-monophosphatase